jgi:hypothetical protein
MTSYKLSDANAKTTMTVKAKTKKAAAKKKAKKTISTRKKTVKKVVAPPQEKSNVGNNKTSGKRSDKNRDNNNLNTSTNVEEWSPVPSEDDTGEFSEDDANNEDEMWEIYEQNSERSESNASWNENYRRLQEFHSTHGHSGVPINWSTEPKFADWVSSQRQLFREIHSGYRIANPREEGRWKRLQVLKFPLDYEKWYRLTRHRYTA